MSEFIQTELEVFSRIDDVYQLGSDESPSLVITFQTMHDKDAVFEKKSQSLRRCLQHFKRKFI